MAATVSEADGRPEALAGYMSLSGIKFCDNRMAIGTSVR
jgi:hypothetical protein